MTECAQQSFQFPVCKGHVVEANFEGGEITSDGGILLLRQIASFKRPLSTLIMNFDATDDAVHGDQEGQFLPRLL